MLAKFTALFLTTALPLMAIDNTKLNEGFQEIRADSDECGAFHGLPGPTGPKGPRGHKGSRGPRGRRGPSTNGGATGATGITGPTGAAGATGLIGGSGGIIPFASFTAVELSSGAPGVLEQGAAIAFGNSTDEIALTPNINAADLDLNTAFIMPADGLLTSISASFRLTAIGVPTNALANVTAQVYIASPNTDTFVPLPGTEVVLQPGFNALNPAGTNLSGILPIGNIPVLAGTRVIVVFRLITDTPLAFAVTATGFASAGLKFEAIQ